jgi:DNA-binding CsgD family transcriptional regulator
MARRPPKRCNADMGTGRSAPIVFSKGFAMSVIAADLLSLSQAHCAGWRPPPATSAPRTRPSLPRGLLDNIDYGIVVLHAGGSHCNRTARLQMGEPDAPLRLQDSEPVAADAAQNILLQAAIRDAAERGRRRLLMLRFQARALAVAVVPVPGDASWDDAGAQVMLLLGRRSACPLLTAQSFCCAHGLTPAESSVLDGLLSGLDPRRIAQQHGVALSTVRTQVASILAKTSTRRIQDLTAAAALLPPVMPLFEAVR